MTKSILDNAFAVLVARVVLGFMFIIASVEKIVDPNAFAVSIGYYKLVGESLAMYVATVLPWVELLCGLLLIFGIMTRGSSLLVVLMLILFTAAVISAIARGLDISCGCFSRDPNVGKIGWLKVAENFGLVLLGIFTYYSTTIRFRIRGLPGHDNVDSNE